MWLGGGDLGLACWVAGSRFWGLGNVDVWVVLSRIADAFVSGWNGLAVMAGPSWPAYAIAGGCIFVSLLLLAFAMLKRAAPERRASGDALPQPTVLVQTAFSDSDARSAQAEAPRPRAPTFEQRYAEQERARPRPESRHL